jgi:hypothetical protein
MATCLRCRGEVSAAGHRCSVGTVTAVPPSASAQGPGGTPAEKRTLVDDWLARGVTMVHLDARRAGVVVPPQHSRDPLLRLNLSYRYRGIDLHLGEERIEATLSFHGHPFRCAIPWSAVFGVTSGESGRSRLWLGDAPPEINLHVTKG